MIKITPAAAILAFLTHGAVAQTTYTKLPRHMALADFEFVNEDQTISVGTNATDFFEACKNDRGKPALVLKKDRTGSFTCTFHDKTSYLVGFTLFNLGETFNYHVHFVLNRSFQLIEHPIRLQLMTDHKSLIRALSD